MPGVNDNLQISALLLEPTAVYSPYTFFISNQFNLPFTEGVIADGWRLKVKINQSKRAWCKSHALNLFI